MEKFIFKKFTIENRILLTSESLQLLKDNVKCNEDVDQIIFKYKEMDPSSSINMEVLRKVIDNFYLQEEKVDFTITPWVFRRSSYIERYNLLKSKVHETLKAVHELNEEESCIFGILYKNKNSKFVLEDESGVIEVELRNTDCFITDFVFLILQGHKVKDRFEVDNVKYPLWSNEEVKRQDIVECKKSILFFYGRCIDDIDTDTSEVFLVDPESNKVREDALNRGFNIVELDKYSLANPREVKVNNKKIILFCNELYKAKEIGTFFGKNLVQSFIKTYISQYDINPFGKPHMYIESIPDAYIIFQQSYSCIEKIDNVFFISVPPLTSNNIYLEYISEVDIFAFRKVNK